MGHFFSDIYSSKITPTHVLHLSFLKRLLGVKKGTDTHHCVLRETGQMPIFFYWFRCTIRFWNSLLSSNNPLLEKVVRADLIANRSDVGKEWAVAGGLNQLESTTKLPVVLTRGASKKMAISTIVDFNLFQLEKWLNQLRLIPG
jgi:hypothetical protein